MSTGHPGIRDAALRAIGRNLVNFQKLEHCLKALVRTEPFAGPMSTMNGRVATRVSKTSQYTLGKAVQEWLPISTPHQTARPQIQDLFEPWISVSFQLPIDSEGLSRPNEVERNAASIRPFIKRTRSELRAMIDGDRLRFAMLADGSIECIRNRTA